MKARSDLTQAEVQALLDYDPCTGFLRWKIRVIAAPGWNGKNAGKTAGAKMGNGYVLIAIHNTKYLAHRVIWLHVYGAWPPAQIDHINMCRDDNRIANLRLATNSENAMNRNMQRNNGCGVKGVYLHKASGLYHARISLDGHVHSLGYWRTAEEAGNVYQTAAKLLHGKFLRLPES